MAFSRIKYDDCATKLKTEREVAPGNYRLFPGFVENCQQCFSEFGPVGSKADVSSAKNSCSLDWSGMAQVESDLTNRNIPLTDCNENATNTTYNKNPVYNKTACTPLLNSEDTRFSNPIQAYRSMSLTDYQLQPFLYSNPQCHVQDDRIGLNSRNKAKDTYTLTMPNIVDQGNVFPKEIVPRQMCTQ